MSQRIALHKISNSFLPRLHGWKFASPSRRCTSTLKTLLCIALHQTRAYISLHCILLKFRHFQCSLCGPGQQRTVPAKRSKTLFYIVLQHTCACTTLHLSLLIAFGQNLGISKAPSADPASSALSQQKDRQEGPKHCFALHCIFLHSPLFSCASNSSIFTAWS